MVFLIQNLTIVSCLEIDCLIFEKCDRPFEPFFLTGKHFRKINLILEKVPNASHIEYLRWGRPCVDLVQIYIWFDY